MYKVGNRKLPLVSVRNESIVWTYERVRKHQQGDGKYKKGNAGSIHILRVKGRLYVSKGGRWNEWDGMKERDASEWNKLQFACFHFYTRYSIFKLAQWNCTIIH